MNHLIKNNDDYEKVLARIDCIFDSKPGSAEFDELELLTALVEIYEKKHFPIDFPAPLEAIKFRMEQLGLKQKDMIPYFGSKSKASEVLNGKRELTLTMMRALNKGLGIPAEVLLKKPDSNFPETFHNIDWSKFPVSEMVKRLWLPKIDNIKEKYEELLRGFVTDNSGLEVLTASYFKQGGRGRFNSQMDKYSLAAWLLRVISVAKAEKLTAKYVKGTINLNTLKEVARLSYFENGPLLAREYLAKQGICLVIVPHLPKTYLDGAALLLPDGSPIVALTLRYDRADNFWFCLLHELAHVSLHLSDSDNLVVDDLDLHNSEINDDVIEREADELAGESLIPKHEWNNIPEEDKNNISSINKHAGRMKIHPAIIVGRIRFETGNYRLFAQHIGNRQIRKRFAEYL